MSKRIDILLENLKTRSESGFELFFQEYYTRLVNYAYYFLFDQSEAEDVVQGLFMSIWENVGSINPRGTFESYLLTAVKNRCLNRLKSINIKDSHDMLYVESILNSEGSQNVGREEELIDALDRLPNQVKQILELKYLEGKKISEISQFLKVSPNSVKTQLQRGRSKLRLLITSKLSADF